MGNKRAQTQQTVKQVLFISSRREQGKPGSWIVGIPRAAGSQSLLYPRYYRLVHTSLYPFDRKPIKNTRETTFLRYSQKQSRLGVVARDRWRKHGLRPRREQYKPCEPLRLHRYLEQKIITKKRVPALLTREMRNPISVFFFASRRRLPVINCWRVRGVLALKSLRFH